MEMCLLTGYMLIPKIQVILIQLFHDTSNQEQSLKVYLKNGATPIFSRTNYSIQSTEQIVFVDKFPSLYGKEMESHIQKK